MTTPKYTLEFFEDEHGSEPVLDWLRRLTPSKRRAIGVAMFEILQYEGPHVVGTILVRLLFDPVAAAAADLMRDEIDLLSNVGVDISHNSVDRLEWDLRDKLQEVIHASPHATSGDPEEDRVLEAIRVAEVAQAKGYALDGELKRVVDNHEELIKVLAEERVLRQSAEDQREANEAATRDQLTKLAKAAIGQTKRGRSRVRRALKHLGLNLDDLLKESEPADAKDE